MRTITILVALWLSGCTEQHKRVPAAVPDTPPVAAKPAVPTPRAPECLCDEQGLPLMAQITRAGVQLGGRELAVFAPFYFVFTRDDDAAGRPLHYTLGTTRWRDSLLPGKAPASAVALWSGVVGAYPIGRVNVYATFDQVEQLVRTGSSSDPIAVSPASSMRRPFLWPIVESKLFTIDGVQHEAWRIHFLGRTPADDGAVPAPAAAAAPRYSDAELDAMQRDLRGLDVVWVIDATGSMEPFWKAAQEAVAGMTARLTSGRAGRAPDVRFGLVAFRDHDKTSEFVTRSLEFGDEASLRAALGAIPINHGGTVAEAGLDALDAALGLAWRGSRLTTRTVIVVSDASYHEGVGAENPRGFTTKALAARARELGVHVVGLAVGQQASSTDRARQLAQYRELAEATGGAALAIEEAEAAVQHIDQLMHGAATRIERNSAVFAAVRDGATTAAEASKRTGMAEQEVTECLEFLAGAVDFARLPPGQPTFASGWVLPTLKGVRQLEMRVLVSRGDCELLHDACRRLILDLGDRPDLVAGLVQTAAGGRSGALGALVLDPRADVAAHLAARHKLVFRRDSVLRLTQAQLAHMSEQDRRARLDGVALALKRLLEFERDDRAWFTVNGTSYAFVAEEVLP